MGTVSAGTGKAANELADDEWTNPTLATVNVIYTVTPVSTPGCLGDPYTVTIPIDPEPVGGTDALTVCSDDGALGYDLQTDNIDLLGNGLTVDSWSWSSVANPNVGGQTTGPSTSGTIDDNLTNITAVDQVVVYTVIPTTGGCAGDAFTVTLTVQPEPVGVVNAGVVCSDEVLGVSFNS